MKPKLQRGKELILWYMGNPLTAAYQHICPHYKVKWTIVEPVTLLPKEGICQDCGKDVTARIVWD